MKIYGLQFEGKWLGVRDSRKDFRRYELTLYDVKIPWFTDNYRVADDIAHHQGVGRLDSPAMPGEFYMKIPKIVELEI